MGNGKNEESDHCEKDEFWGEENDSKKFSWTRRSYVKTSSFFLPSSLLSSFLSSYLSFFFSILSYPTKSDSGAIKLLIDAFILLLFVSCRPTLSFWLHLATFSCLPFKRRVLKPNLHEHHLFTLKSQQRLPELLTAPFFSPYPFPITASFFLPFLLPVISSFPFCNPFNSSLFFLCSHLE